MEDEEKTENKKEKRADGYATDELESPQQLTVKV